jgi:hypothetical protein
MFMMAAEATSIKLVPRTLDTKGKDRDARRLHSMTLSVEGTRDVERLGDLFGDFLEPVKVG